MISLKILNFGSVNIDFTYRMDHFVLPGETQLAYSVAKNAGGKGFNQSVALARAGCTVYHAGRIGRDGEFLKKLLEDDGINTEYLEICGEPTGNAVIQVDNNGDNCIILYGGANQAIDEEYIKRVLENFGEDDVIVLQNEISHMNELLQLAYGRGMKIVLNPAPMNGNISPEYMAYADWIILNETEAFELTGHEESFRQLNGLSERCPNTSFVLTLGENGAVCKGGDGETYKVDACTVKAVDTTAAGDTFIGFFLHGFLTENKQDPRKALEVAVCASGLAVTRRGAMQSIPNMREVIESGLEAKAVKL